MQKKNPNQLANENSRETILASYFDVSLILNFNLIQCLHNLYSYFCCCTKLATGTSNQAFLNMDRIQLTGNGSKLNLLGKIREITSNELIFGGFLNKFLESHCAAGAAKKCLEVQLCIRE